MPNKQTKTLLPKRNALLPLLLYHFRFEASIQNTRPHQSQTPGRPTMMMPTTTYHHHQSQYPGAGQMPAPMSFIMMDNESPGGFMMGGPNGAALPMTMSSSNNFEPIVTEPTTTTSTSTTSTSPAASQTSANNNNNNNLATSDNSNSPLTMLGPSMTMTIQSEPGGVSNIELSTNINGGGQSGALIQQRPYGTKWMQPHGNSGATIRHVNQQLRQPYLNNYQQQQQPVQFHQNLENFDEQSGAALAGEGPGGEQYYSSPWAGRLVSPAKLLRAPKQPQQQQYHHHQQQQQQQQHHAAQSLPAPTFEGGRLTQFHPFPAPHRATNQLAAAPPTNWQQNEWTLTRQQLQQAHISQALEQEELLPVGQPQEMPVYQAPNGQLHISLPNMQSGRTPASPSNLPASTSTSQQPTKTHEREPLRLVEQNAINSDSDQNGDNAEVQTLPGGQNQQQPASTTTTTQRPQSGQLQQQPKTYAVVNRPSAPTTTTTTTTNTNTGGATKTSGRLVSPAVKGKQQLQQLQHQSNKGTTEQRTIVAGGY